MVMPVASPADVVIEVARACAFNSLKGERVALNFFFTRLCGIANAYLPVSYR